MTLADVRAQLARYSIAGPIPIALEAAVLATGSIEIAAVATVPDVDAWQARGELVPTTVRHRGTVGAAAGEPEVAHLVEHLVRGAFRHELGEWFLCDGRPVNDPHHGAPRVL